MTPDDSIAKTPSLEELCEEAESLGDRINNDRRRAQRYRLARVADLAGVLLEIQQPIAQLLHCGLQPGLDELPLDHETESLAGWIALEPGVSLPELLHRLDLSLMAIEHVLGLIEFVDGVRKGAASKSAPSPAPAKQPPWQAQFGPRGSGSE